MPAVPGLATAWLQFGQGTAGIDQKISSFRLIKRSKHVKINVFETNTCQSQKFGQMHTKVFRTK